MTRRRGLPILTFLAALLVAVASVVSAARMAPAAPEPPEVVAYLAAGGQLADLCGGTPGHDDHPCPFCRLLGDPPRVRLDPPATRLTPILAWQALGHLTAGPERGNPRVSARAPPARA